MGEISFESRGGELPSDWYTAICEIHDAVFLKDPFVWTSSQDRENADGLRQMASDPTFGVVVALSGSKLVGYAYGYRLPSSHGWWHAIPEPLSPVFIDEWEGRTFTLESLAILPEFRGIGVGKRLIGELLQDRTEERAVLSVQPTALETQSIYLHLGWRLVGRNGPFPDVTPPRWDVYVLEDMPSSSSDP